MMREIRVKNASIYAEIEGRKIDVEIRTSKDSALGLALFIDNKKILDLSYKDGKFIDGEYYDNRKAILQLGEEVSV